MSILNLKALYKEFRESPGWMNAIRYYLIFSILSHIISGAVFLIFLFKLSELNITYLVPFLIFVFFNLRIFELLIIPDERVIKKIRLYIIIEIITGIVQIYFSDFDLSDYTLIAVIFLWEFITNAALFLLLLYITFFKRIKDYYSKTIENAASFSWVYFLRYTLFSAISLLGVFELREFLDEKRNFLDIIASFLFISIHGYIIHIMNQKEKKALDAIVFWYAVVFVFYFVHHQMQFLFYSAGLSDFHNYHLWYAIMTAFWCIFWILLFLKQKEIRGHYL